MFLFSLRLSTKGIYYFDNFSQLKMKGTCKHMSHTCICSFPFFLKILACTVTNVIVVLSCIYIMTLFLFLVFSLSSLIILFLILMRALVFLLHRALSCDELSHGDSCDAGICIWLHNTFLHVFGLFWPGFLGFSLAPA